MLESLAGRGRYLIASCDDGQVSVEAETWGHGLFTYHLLEGIRGAGDRDGDGKVGLAELFEYVAEAVERDAQAVGVVQRPWSSSIGPGGAFLATPPPVGPLGAAPQNITEPPPWVEMGDRDCDDTNVFDVREGQPRPIDAVIARLAELRRTRDPAAVPEIFGGLVHASDVVRDEAKKAARALGWEKTSTAVLALARQGGGTALRTILEGLAAFESHRDVVALLDRLVVFLGGDLRTQAILILDRKRLVLGMEKAAAVFRAIQSPLRLTRVLGQGLFTSAYAATDEDDEFGVVVRVLRPEFAGQPTIRTKFLDIGRQSRKIVHQNLVLTREVRAFPEHDLYFVVRDHVRRDNVAFLALRGLFLSPARNRLDLEASHRGAGRAPFIGNGPWRCQAIQHLPGE